jgi:hypothetical protein
MPEQEVPRHLHTLYQDGLPEKRGILSLPYSAYSDTCHFCFSEAIAATLKKVNTPTPTPYIYLYSHY